MSFLQELPAEIPWFIKPVDGWLLKHGFIYLVMEGHRPQGTDWVRYLWDRSTNPLIGAEAKVDRVGVAQVFRNLKDELNKP